jgi:hypothetical protein
MNEIPPLPTAQLKLVVTDPDELAKGLAIADKGGLKHLARYGNKLFAEAEGSGSAPYKVQIVHDAEKGYRGRCSCMAARSRPFCKHASALLVLWARDTNAFAVSEAAPEPAAEPGGAAKRAKTKTGKVDASALMRQGVEQTLTLVRELALSGITTMSAERIAQVRALAETLRAERLRRMSARLMELAGLLATAARDYASLDTEDYGAALADLWLAARRVQKHLDGETLPLEHVETLIGRSWTKKDRAPIQDLHLIEYAFVQEVTADDFVIRESRLLDLSSGTHYSEKQILPAFLAKRTAPKRSYEGFLLAGASGGRYPGFAPHRLDLSEPGSFQPVAADAVARICDQAMPGVADALARLTEHRKDVFAPDSCPVAVRVNSLMAEGDRLLALDESGDSLLIEGDASAQIALTSALAGAHLRAILGDLLLLGAIPALQPLALVVERSGTAVLETLPAASAEALLGARKRRREPAPGKRPRWLDTARELGVGSAAITLGEVREELADILSEGLSALTSRRADGLVERLRQLNLAKPADLLAQVAQHADPAEKIDGVVRLLQVLGIGLSRLAASRNVNRDSLAPSPLHPAIMVLPPKETLDADGLLQELHTNRLVGHSRAVAIDRTLRSFDQSTLARLAPTLFGDGSVSSLVAEHYAAHPDVALDLARNILGQGQTRYTMKGWSAPARVARYTAVQVLRRMGSAEARSLLKSSLSGAAKDTALQNVIRRALGMDSSTQVPESLLDNLKAGNWETRAEALARVIDQGCLAALPQVRRIAAADPSTQVRHRAWYAQAALLDVDAVPVWISALKQRAVDDDAGREALHALAHIGDNRSIAPLLDAFEESYKPGLVAEALRAFGPAILPPLLDRLESRPELVERKVTIDIGTGVEWSSVDEWLAQKFSGLQFSFGAGLFSGELRRLGLELQHPRAVALLVQGMAGFVVAGAALPHLPQDLQPPLAQAAQRAGVALALFPLRQVIRLRPRAHLAAAIAPQMHRVAQVPVAVPPDARLPDLPALKTHRRRPRHALQRLRLGILPAIGADLGEQPRRELVARAGQAAEEVVVGMLREEFFNRRPVRRELGLHHAQQVHHAQGQPALGPCHRWPAAELVGAREDFQPRRHRLRPPQPVRVQELFPAPLPGFDQFLRGGKGGHELPGVGLRPVVKGLQGGGIILLQGRLQLVDQRRALRDQLHLVAAEQAQFLHQRIGGRERAPVLAVQPQRVGETPRVDLVGLRAGGHVAIAIALRRLGVHRIHGDAAGQQLFHRRTVTGLDGHAEGGE